MLRVLLIEDDAGDAILVDRTLEHGKQQFVLDHCECLEDALNCIKEDDFDVALLDLSLPDSFGLSGMEKLQAHAPEIPIVVLTGLADDALALQALEQGAQDYLVKGYATAELLQRTLLYAVQRQQVQTENRRLLTTMEELARQDPLTGVLNRHSFAENLEREWKRAIRYRRPLACVVLDIDFFKRVNDTYGHAAGDQTLQEIANTLCSASRAADVVGRLGGEEFCVLLPETSEEDAVVWAERLRRTISDLIIPVEREALQVTASLGVASRRVDALQAQLLVDQADEAMFVAKQLGRDQVISFGRMREFGCIEPSQIWHGVTAEELISSLQASLSRQQTIDEAIRMLQSERVDSLPVLGADGQLLGVMGEDDIMAASLTSGHLFGTVGELMQTQLVTFTPGATAREVCEFLCRSALRQVFVVDGTRPLGVIRRTDVVRHLSQSIGINAANRHESMESVQEDWNAGRASDATALI